MNKADHPEGKHDGYRDYHYDNEEVGESRSAGSGEKSCSHDDRKGSTGAHSSSAVGGPILDKSVICHLPPRSARGRTHSGEGGWPAYGPRKVRSPHFAHPANFHLGAIGIPSQHPPPSIATLTVPPHTATTRWISRLLASTCVACGRAVKT